MVEIIPSRLKYLGPIVAAKVPSGTKESSDIVACLAPQETHVDTTYQALESVLLQHYFGIQEFFLYDNGLTHKAMGALSQATKKFSNFTRHSNNLQTRICKIMTIYISKTTHVMPLIFYG